MNDKYNKLPHRLALSASISLFFVFTFLLYAPLRIYIENKDTLWFNFDATLKVSLIISAVGLLISLLMTVVPKKIIHVGMCCLLFALALGLFVQGNYMNIDYGSGVLDGSEIAWKDYTTYGALTSAVWAACLAFPFALFMVFRNNWRRVLMVISLGLVIAQGVNLAVMLNDNSGSLNKITYEVTTDGIYELSEDENTIVFVLDSFDDEYLSKIKKSYPDYKERLSGFTEYSNTLATGSGASLALPSLLTGEVYTRDESYTEYIDHIWSGDTVYSKLNDNGVDTRVFAQTEYFGDNANNYINNIIDHTDGLSASLSMTKTLYKYACYTYAPHYLKEYFWLDLDTITRYRSSNAYTLNDAKFYSDYVTQGGYAYTDEYSNAVRIYNLNGARGPYLLTKNTIKSSNTTSLNEQVMGCFNCLFTMIDDLKENGVYENANIIITANVGNKNLTQHPVLLIKRQGESEGYSISNAPVSNFDFAPTLASLVTDEYGLYGSGRTYFRAQEDTNRVRTFYLNTGENSDIRIDKYMTYSKATDMDSLTLHTSYYANDSEPEKYKLGTSLSFEMDATANAYCTEGFCNTTGWRTSLAGPSSQMIIPVHHIPSDAEDVHVFIGIHSIDKPSKCTIYANGRQVFSAKINETFVSSGLNFTVPTSAISDDNTILLEFNFSGISENEYELDTNKRTKTISFDTFKMYTQ